MTIRVAHPGCPTLGAQRQGGVSRVKTRESFALDFLSVIPEGGPRRTCSLGCKGICFTDNGQRTTENGEPGTAPQQPNTPVPPFPPFTPAVHRVLGCAHRPPEIPLEPVNRFCTGVLSAIYAAVTNSPQPNPSIFDTPNLPMPNLGSICYSTTISSCFILDSYQSWRYFQPHARLW